MCDSKECSETVCRSKVPSVLGMPADLRGADSRSLYGKLVRVCYALKRTDRLYVAVDVLWRKVRHSSLQQ